MGEWSEKINNSIGKNMEESAHRESFHVDVFKRNISRVEKFSESCSFCDKQRIEIEDMVGKIDEAFEVPGNSRREYDRLAGRLTKHMRKEHGLFKTNWFVRLYTLFGLIAGFLVGFLLSFFLPEFKTTMYVFALSFFIVAGILRGRQKDLKVKLENKLM